MNRELKNKKIHPDLLLAEKHIYEPLGLVLQGLNIEAEGAEYGASEFILNNAQVKFRVGKITPTKIGQFVTFWKREGNGPISPCDLEDPFDYLFVSVRAENNLGTFIFPKKVLGEKGIVSKNKTGGKRAMRIYPSWDKPESAEARKTQEWQLRYFLKSQPTYSSSLLHDEISFVLKNEFGIVLP